MKCIFWHPNIFDAHVWTNKTTTTTIPIKIIILTLNYIYLTAIVISVFLNY